ncbi:MAG: acyl-CoA thioesterase [Nitriliruptoraceae bacterium]
MATSLTVRFHELDPYGHVNHAVYLTYLEQARVEHLAAAGLDLLELADRYGWQLVVVSVEARYLAAAGVGDVLTVTCRLAERRRASAVLAQEVRRGAAVLVRARVRVATVDAEGRAIALPGVVIDALAAGGTA